MIDTFKEINHLEKESKEVLLRAFIYAYFGQAIDRSEESIDISITINQETTLTEDDLVELLTTFKGFDKKHAMALTKFSRFS